MKKTFLLGFIFCVLLQSSFAQRWNNISSHVSQPASINLISESNQEIILGIKTGGFATSDVITPRGSEVIVSLPNTSPALWKDAPDLGKLTTSFIIPDIAEMTYEVIASSYTDFSNVSVAPSKGNLYRNVDPATVPYSYGKPYTLNEFFPGRLAELRTPHIVRDFRAQTIVIYPFQYNPVTKTLRVYYDLTIKIKPTGNTGVNILNRTKPLTSIDSDFQKIYKKQFLNFSSSRYTPVEEDGKMLIISYGQYMSAMQPFINWKTTTGMEVEMVDVSSIGTTASSIKTYVQNYYDTEGLTYLLLVGDAQHIPPITSGVGGPSDVAYGFTVGTDHYPDLFVGRFSAESIADVQTQVQRSVEYEMGPDTTGGWLGKAICIASAEGGGGQGDNGESDQQHQRIIYNKDLGFTYSFVQELFDGYLAGGTDVSGDPSASTLGSVINGGSGNITYTGHGSDNSFVTTGFSNTNVGQLTNHNQLPFIWSVACVNGNFQNQTCFAEAWMRATHNGEPTGAVATLMSTINQSWNPPMRGQDEMVDILVESYQNNIKRTFGGLSFNGCMNMNEVYGSQGDEMTDTWSCFGDPSLMVRTKSWDVMTVSHVAVTPVGTSQIQVGCNVEGAKVALTLNGQILGTGYVVGGNADVTFTAVSAVDTITVCVTAFNQKAYLGEILIIVPAGPYLVYKTNTINDAAGNNNGIADFGESILLNVTLENVGVDLANNVSATISTTSNLVTITDNTNSFGSIAASSTSLQNDAFALTINDDVADNSLIPFVINITSDTNSWTGSFSLNLNAPAFTVGNILVDDATGNNNHTLDPGETVTLTIGSTNSGHSDAPSTEATIQTVSQHVSVVSGTVALNNVAFGASVNPSFSITVDPNAIIGSVVVFDYTIQSGNYSATKQFSLKVGVIREDCETGDMSQFPWITSGSADWFISTQTPFEGQYCMQSGDIAENGTTELKISLNVLANDSISFYRKVSCEDNTYGGWWDYLQFDIDAISKEKWDGEVDWSRVVYPVSSGQHEFKWSYIKDGYADAGSDCAWIDYIIFPPVYDSSTEVAAPVKDMTFSIYPNPSSETLTISYTLKSTSKITIKMTDNSGKLIRMFCENETNSAGLNSTSCKLSGIRTGMYYISIHDGHTTITRPVIIGH